MSEPPRRNLWAIAGLVFGILGLSVALTAPIPFIPLLSAFTWPLGLGAILLGHFINTDGNPGAAAQTRWGIRLGCLGWIIQVITSLVKLMVLTGLITLAITSFFNGPTPTPIP